MYHHSLKILTRRRSFWTAAAPSSPFTKYSNRLPSKIDYNVLFSSLPPTQITTLPNGFRIATQPLPTKTTTVGIWVDPGPYLTSLKWKGVDHVLDRLVYKGTDLEREIATMGGDLVALTSPEQISFQATGLMNIHDVFQSMQFLGSILQDPRFRDEDVDRVRAVVMRERQEAEDQLEKEFLLENLHASAFQNTALGTPIVGSLSKIKTITKGDILNYMFENFTSDRMVLVVAGEGTRHEEIVEHAQFLGNMPGRGVSLDRIVNQGKDLFKKVSRAVLLEEPGEIFIGSEVHIEDYKELLGKFVIAFEGASSADEDGVPLMVIEELLGSTLLARVGGNGIAENVMTFNTNYKDVGLFGVYAIAEPDCLGDLASLVMLELTELCSKVSHDDLVRARNKVKASLLLNMDKTKWVAEDIGCQILARGRRIPYAELFDKIDAVDVKVIKRVASRFIYDEDLVVVAAGPIQGMPDYNWFRHRTSAVLNRF